MRHRRGLAGLAWLLGVGLVCSFVLGFDLEAEPHFVDESAYYSQSYYAGLWLDGRWNDAAWLDYPAYDLPPLPKYLIGVATRLAGYRSPTPADAAAWYADTSRRFDPPGALRVARWPIVMLGVVGCLAVFGIGRLVVGPAVGAAAALLLAFNPLYRMLSRRAMSDVPCEAFTLLALWIGLNAWVRWQRGESMSTVWGWSIAAGLACGLALLCKMSGLLSLFVLASWAGLGLAVARSPRRPLAAAALTLGAGAAAAGTFASLNPYLFAQPTPPIPPVVRPVAALGPLARARKLVDLRVEVASGQKQMFPHNAVNTAYDKISTVLIQGFGRFGPFGPSHSDSTRRYDRSQDQGAVVWLSIVAAGCVWAALRGRFDRGRGEPPAAWALLVGFGVVVAVVTAYLPLAWDRYFLSLQAPACLLAAGGILDGLPRMLRRPAIDEGT